MPLEHSLSPDDLAAIAILRGRAQADPCLMPAYGSDSVAPHRAFLRCGLTIIFTIDKAHWFPNQDWQNCWHLSVSQNGREPDRELERALLRAAFPACLQDQLCLEHRPGSPVHHWRLFFTDQGEFIVPEGEMYTRQGTAEYFRKREKAKARQVRPDFEEEE